MDAWTEDGAGGGFTAGRRNARRWLVGMVAAGLSAACRADDRPDSGDDPATPTITTAASLAPTWRPGHAFVQVARAQRTDSVSLGARWTWRRRAALWGGELGGAWEASIGRWQARGSSAHPPGSFTDVGLTPVWTWRPSPDAAWWVEAGIGAHLVAPVYRSAGKSFSTRFNFGDHLGVAWRLPGAPGVVASVRVQHLSNAGIRHPNPGEDFVQLRLVWPLSPEPLSANAAP